MAYKLAADGIVKKGKTDDQVFPNDGPQVAIKSGPKHAGSKGGKKNIDMKTMGRGLAKIAAQKKG